MFLVVVCLSKVELFLRRNSVRLFLLLLLLLLILFSSVGEGVPRMCHRCATSVPQVFVGALSCSLAKALCYKPCFTEGFDLSKVELIRRRNNHTACDKEVPDLSKVELFPRRNVSEWLIPCRGILKEHARSNVQE